MRFRTSNPGSGDAQAMLTQYTAHLVDTVPDGFDISTDSPPPEGSFEAPNGRFLVAYDTTTDPSTPIGCGAVWVIRPGVAEIRRMWITPSHQGQGLGRAMLEALEAAAIELGCHTARLDSMHALEAAVAMYRSHGYQEIENYNDNPNATIWMQRPLPTGDG
ncbi:MAG: GNAT family N-acetyltransferase [Microthrixaceae bacterium]